MGEEYKGRAFMIRWKIVAIAGGGAFLLSLILGIASGNPFLTILLRALLFGIIFAVLAGGGALFLERFIPELFGSESASDTKKRENIDIVLAEENPVKEGEIEELSLDEPADTEESATEAPPRGTLPEKADGAMTSIEEEELETADEAGLGNEADELEKQATSPVAVESEEASLEEEEVTSSEPVEKKIQQIKTAKGDVLDGSDLDVLPDMSGFESSFSAVPGTGAPDTSPPFENYDSASLKSGALNKDPDTYVKAVRTMIKREEGKKQ
jgi:hypothetical protein